MPGTIHEIGVGSLKTSRRDTFFVFALESTMLIQLWSVSAEISVNLFYTSDIGAKYFFEYKQID